MDIFEQAYGDRAGEVRDLIRDAADGDPGEANEPELCWCGKGYVGHDPAHRVGGRAMQAIREIELSLDELYLVRDMVNLANPPDPTVQDELLAKIGSAIADLEEAR